MNKNGLNDLRRTGLVRKLSVLALTAAAFALGYYFADDRDAVIPAAHDPQKAPHVEASRRAAERSATRSVETELWTCSMHPQIKLAHPGKCPICGMDLVPVGTGGAHKRFRQYSMSPAARKLAQVETTAVKREGAALRVRMVGMVFEDETRVAALTSRVDGRLDEVHVNFTGIKVNKGDPMVTIWSPTLIRSQVELFETIRSREYGETVVRGSEEKLKQFGLTDAQIREIREKKTPMPYTTLRAPISGVVMKKNVVLGDFVKEGTVMYEITDLSKVWIKLDAYESDLPWIRYGQKVTFTTQSVPGRKFKGKVLFIDPVVQMDSRSVKVRVEAENPDLLLKPHMFVTAEVEAELDRYGRVINREWVGKYICPVHPDSVSSEPGICPRSKLPRRPAEAYGYAPDLDPVPPLVVPATAVLYTGKRSLVYVETPDTDMPTYEPRRIMLGPRAGDKYVVYRGLKAGERVVTKGNFKIDSAAQILAGASMMNPAGPDVGPFPFRQIEEALTDEGIKAPRAFRKAWTLVQKGYARLKDALANGKSENARSRARQLTEILKKANVSLLDVQVLNFWNRLSDKMIRSLEEIAGRKEIPAQREAFRAVSEAAATMALGFRNVLEGPVYVFRCPIVFNGEGAYWLEDRQDHANPYLGGKMPACAELLATIPPEEPTSRAKGSRLGKNSHEKEGSKANEGSGGAHGDRPQGSRSKNESSRHDSHSAPQ